MHTVHFNSRHRQLEGRAFWQKGTARLALLKASTAIIDDARRQLVLQMRHTLRVRVSRALAATFRSLTQSPLYLCMACETGMTAGNDGCPAAKCEYQRPVWWHRRPQSGHNQVSCVASASGCVLQSEAAILPEFTAKLYNCSSERARCHRTRLSLVQT